MKTKRHVSIRTDGEMLDKFYYASKFNGRSGSSQIIYLMRKFIADFEKENGPITEDDLKSFFNDK